MLQGTYIQVIIQVPPTLHIVVKVAQLEFPSGHVIPNDGQVFDLRPLAIADFGIQVLQKCYHVKGIDST